MIDLTKFRENAKKDGLCEEYSNLWDNCTTKKQLVDLCLGIKGIDYICDAIAKGWGMTPFVLSVQFKKFINGHYIYDNGVYKTKMYCCHRGVVECDTTALCIIESDVVVNMPDNSLAEIYVTGKSSIELSGNGRCAVIVYGNEVSITEKNGSKVHYKVIYKKEKDKYQ